MTKPFLGKGVSFPFEWDRELSDLKPADAEESIRQSIRIILSTAKGERVMRPEFGCGIYDFVFDMATASTAGRVSQAIRESLLKFEPRIDVLNIKVVPMTRDEGEMLYISIDYEVRATNNAFNLVYPFYLERNPSQW